jgi:hypothetical protein
MSPRIENAIDLPSGLHAGFSGPDDTDGSMCRSSRSLWLYRFGRASSVSGSSGINVTAATRTVAAMIRRRMETSGVADYRRACARPI